MKWCSERVSQCTVMLQGVKLQMSQIIAWIQGTGIKVNDLCWGFRRLNLILSFKMVAGKIVNHT